MAEDLAIPDGVNVPLWYRRLLEARAAAGPANPTPTPPPVVENPPPNVPPPVVPVPPPPIAEAPFPPPPPQHPQVEFTKVCKDFKAMGGKNFLGTESFVEARNWLKDTGDK